MCVCFAAGADDVSRELAAAAAAADMPHELRRQMYNEAHAFKHSPLFTQKVRLFPLGTFFCGLEVPLIQSQLPPQCAC